MVKWIVIGVLVLAGFGAVFGSSSGDNNDGGSGGSGGGNRDHDRSSQIGDEIGAQAVCRDFVKAHLKAPSTAEFSGEAPRHVSGPKWIVVGDVDSQNGFGAMLRSKYICTLHFVANDRYRLTDLQIH